MSLAVLPTKLAVEAAWDDYVRLVREREVDPSLMTDIDHSIMIVRAWRRWFDAFLKVDTE